MRVSGFARTCDPHPSRFARRPLPQGEVLCSVACATEQFALKGSNTSSTSQCRRLKHELSNQDAGALAAGELADGLVERFTGEEKARGPRGDVNHAILVGNGVACPAFIVTCTASISISPPGRLYLRTVANRGFDSGKLLIEQFGELIALALSQSTFVLQDKFYE